MISNDKKKFSPGTFFVFLNVAYCLLYFYIFFLFIMPYILGYRADLDWIEVIKKKDYFSMFASLPFVYLYFPTFFSTIILAPMMKDIYSVIVSPEYVSGARSPVPFLAFPIKIPWETVKYVRYMNLMYLRYYVFYDRMNRAMIYIPCEVAKYDEFKNEVYRCAPANHIFKTLLRNEKRGHLFPKLKWGVYFINAFVELSVTGKIVGKKNFSMMKINLFHNGHCVAEFLTNNKGEFNHTFDYFAGEYLLRAEGYGVTTEKKIKLPMKMSDQLIIHIYS